MQGLESLTHDTGVGLLGVIPDRETELTQLYQERVDIQSIARSVFHRVDAPRRLKEALAAQIPRDTTLAACSSKESASCVWQIAST